MDKYDLAAEFCYICPYHGEKQHKGFSIFICNKNQLGIGDCPYLGFWDKVEGYLWSKYEELLEIVNKEFNKKKEKQKEYWKNLPKKGK